MFNFSITPINLNYINDDLRKVIAHTDSRIRGDMRLFEEGKVDEADEEKIRLEVKQRRARKIRADTGEEWWPKFFKEAQHPYYPSFKHYESLKDKYWQ